MWSLLTTCAPPTNMRGMCMTSSSAAVCSGGSNIARAAPSAVKQPRSSGYQQHAAAARRPTAAAGAAAGLSGTAAQAAKPSRRLPRSPRAVTEQATAAAAGAATAADPRSQLPRSPGAMVDQAAAVQAAVEGGCMRQTIFLLLPINEKEADFNSVEPVDYPCSLQKVCVVVGGGVAHHLGCGHQRCSVVLRTCIHVRCFLWHARLLHSSRACTPSSMIAPACPCLPAPPAPLPFLPGIRCRLRPNQEPDAAAAGARHPHQR
jgi:hypothetical protein